MSDDVFGSVLGKACNRSSCYRVAIEGGLILEFSQAEELAGGWIHLEGIESVIEGPEARYPNGIDVQRDRILWIADDPMGS